MSDLFKALALLSAAVTVLPCHAETIVIRAQGVRFLPDIVRAQVGDDIAFRNMSAHFVEGVPGMWPAGASELRSATGADYDYRLEQEGLYVIKCPPHWGARMGLVIAVGDPAGLAGKVSEYEALASIDKAAKPASGLLKKFRERMGLK